MAVHYVGAVRCSVLISFSGTIENKVEGRQAGRQAERLLTKNLHGNLLSDDDGDISVLLLWCCVLSWLLKRGSSPRGARLKHLGRFSFM